jgi:hypothetical protein
MSLLDAHIAFLGGQVDALDPSRAPELFRGDIEDAVALSLSFFERLEQAAVRKHSAAGEWREDNARSMIPAYKDWYAAATKTLEHVRALKSRGVIIQRTPDFMHAYLRARMMAVEFESIHAALMGPDGTARTIRLEDP